MRGTSPRKRFGQHFLAQPATAERIVQGAELDASDVVVEVGPGLGALTQFIMRQVDRLHLVELDRDLANYLQGSVPSAGCQVFVHPQDVLTFDFVSLSQMEGKRVVVLGNLPYNISSPLIFQLLESRSALKRSIFMVQKEVGERLMAKPGGKEYGVLSVLLGIYARVSPLFSVGPGQFYPPPRVDSLVVAIDFEEEPHQASLPFEGVRNVVNVAFQQRRKTLLNSLKSLVRENVGLLAGAFAECGIDPKRRPETLSPEEFLLLSEALYRAKGALLRKEPLLHRGI